MDFVTRYPGKLTQLNNIGATLLRQFYWVEQTQCYWVHVILLLRRFN